jgi:predicted nucleic acid-binding protein
VECVSAVGRGERSAALDAAQAEEALRRLSDLGQRWVEVQPVGSVRTTARRLLRLHPLRSADALQLAAAIVCAEGEPGVLPFVCLDARLADAARREGFTVLEPA